MRLLDTETGQFVEKDPERTRYAILSHTWDIEKGEQTYKELKKIQRRYGLGARVSRSLPYRPTTDAWLSSSSSQTPRNSILVNTYHRMRSRLSASWFARIRGELILWLQCCRTRPSVPEP